MFVTVSTPLGVSLARISIETVLFLFVFALSFTATGFFVESGGQVTETITLVESQPMALQILYCSVSE